MIRPLLIILLSILVLTAAAQQERRAVRQGNRNYNKSQFLESEIRYKEALDKNATLTEANFNLGDAYYRQKKYDLAAGQFEIAASKTSEQDIKRMSYHNLGNAYLKMYEAAADTQPNSPYLDKAINAYKNALKIKPDDMDTKYNLSYALKLKKKNQGQGQKNQQKQQNQNKDQKDKNKQDQKKDQQQKQQNGKEEQKEQKKQLTKEESDKMLKALQNEEKKTQDKVLKLKQKPERMKIDKDW